MPTCNGSVVITVKPKTVENFRKAAILLLNILQKRLPNEICMLSEGVLVHFRFSGTAVSPASQVPL
jgi:hypothetical protein